METVERKPQIENLEWVNNTTEIYVFSKKGRFYKTSFSSNQIEKISNHNFKNGSYFLMSPDGRYIIYGSTLKDESRQDLYLYDIDKQIDTKIFETPKFDSIDIKFSPNGKELALLNIGHPHRQDPSKEGIFIIKLEDQLREFITYPANADLPQLNVYGRELQWAKDGRHIYLAFNGRVNKEDRNQIREYHKFNISKAKFLKIDGRYDLNSNKYYFSENGLQVNTYEADYIQSQSGYRKRTSPVKSIEAFIDQDHDLIIKNNDGTKIIVATGNYNQCAGVTISIVAWLANDDYLIYRNMGDIYIYGIAEAKSSLLFNVKGYKFAWHTE